jgi:hypothetical protein
MTPHAIRGPGLPVVRDFSCPPLPLSSAPAKITIDRPITDFGPNSFTIESSILTVATPDSSHSILPISPTIRELGSSDGAPCVLPVGRKSELVVDTMAFDLKV